MSVISSFFKIPRDTRNIIFSYYCDEINQFLILVNINKQIYIEAIDYFYNYHQNFQKKFYIYKIYTDDLSIMYRFIYACFIVIYMETLDIYRNWHLSDKNFLPMYFTKYINGKH
jgi:hypothetical protein